MESQNIEYKRQWDDKYLRYISGFANAQGGTLLIGVDDSGQVGGITNTKYLLETIPNKSIQSTGIIPNLECLTADGKEYLAIHIHASNQPISCNGKFYLRSGSTLQELNGTALVDFISRKSNTTWDMHIEPRATIGDIDYEAVRYFINRAVAINRLDSSVINADILDILKKLKLVTSDGQFTFAAMMLFGKDVEAYCYSAAFRIGRFGRDLMFDDTITCPLIYMPERVMQTLRNRYLVVNMQFEGMLRKEPLEIPEEALREMICNAIVHRDYSGTNIQMKVYDEQIRLWNPGGLPFDFTIDTLMHKHESYPRNSLIANIFFLAGFIEHWGRGYEKIQQGFQEAHLQLPTFVQEQGGFTAIIPREFFASTRQNTTQEIRQVSMQVKNLVITLKGNTLTKKEMIELGKLGKLPYKSREQLETKCLNPAIELGLVAMQYPESPRHPQQHYYLTEKGKKLSEMITTQ